MSEEIDPVTGEPIVATPPAPEGATSVESTADNTTTTEPEAPESAGETTVESAPEAEQVPETDNSVFLSGNFSVVNGGSNGFATHSYRTNNADNYDAAINHVGFFDPQQSIFNLGDVIYVTHVDEANNEAFTTVVYVSSRKDGSVTIDKL